MSKIRHLLAIFVLLATSGCINLTQPSIAERLSGSWKQQGVVMGERRESIITFKPDGTFTEATWRDRGIRLESNPVLYGRWRVEGDVVTLGYDSGFTGFGVPETERRQVLQLTDSRFVSLDTQFGIVVERDRYVGWQTK